MGEDVRDEVGEANVIMCFENDDDLPDLAANIFIRRRWQLGVGGNALKSRQQCEQRQERDGSSCVFGHK